MTPRFTCGARRALTISRHQGLLTPSQCGASPASNRALQRRPRRPAGRRAPRTGGAPHQALHVVRAALAQLLALNPLAGQHAPRGVLRVRARHHHLSAARAPVTAWRSPEKDAHPGSSAWRASCSARSRVRGHRVAGSPACAGMRSGPHSLRLRRRRSSRWLSSGLTASLSVRTRLRQVVADRRGEQRGVVPLVDIV